MFISKGHNEVKVKGKNFLIRQVQVFGWARQDCNIFRRGCTATYLKLLPVLLISRENSGVIDVIHFCISDNNMHLNIIS
jgi:hypothetical protein